MQTIFGWMLVVGITFLGLPLYADSIEQLAEDARTIIDSGDGTVRRWQYDPTIVVVHDQPLPSNAIEETVSRISTVTGLDFGEIRFVDISDVSNDPEFATGTRFVVEQREGIGQFRSRMRVGGLNASDLVGDIFIFFVQPEMAATFMIATDTFGGSDLYLERSYLLGFAPCIYRASVARSGMASVRIFINPAQNEIHAECVHEELYHAMGLLNDAVDSSNFSLDGQIENDGENCDEVLLRELYRDEIVSGNSVDVVVESFLENVSSCWENPSVDK